MKNTDKHESLELEQYLDDGDILYSPKDKQYFRLALDAVINHSMGLAVIGSNETALTHYSRILTSRLRKEKTLRLSTFPPANTEDLLQKFNQLLSEMTIDQEIGRAHV
jgi:ribosomal protein L16 Arg81 hydroxylase